MKLNLWNNPLGAGLLVVVLSLSYGRLATGATDVLDFRSIFISYEANGAVGAPTTSTLPRPHLQQLDKQMDQWSREGFNLVMGFNSGALNGIDSSHQLIQHKKFPGARALSPEEEDDFTSRVQPVRSPGVATLPFRACFLSFGDPRPSGANDAQKAANQAKKLASMTPVLQQYRAEGFNVVVWMGVNELWPPGHQAMLRLDQFPEACKMSASDTELSISYVKSVFAAAKRLGMDNYLYSIHLHYTAAFAKAHGLPAGGCALTGRIRNVSDVRNALTTAYIKAIYAQMVRTYNDLDGFYGPLGEALPGVRSTFFREAIAPGLKQGGRKVRYIVNQWQVPLQDYLRDVVPSDVYDNTWLGYHAYNGEQITVAAPYPSLVGWAISTGLPTVAAVYPANIQNFPFNSPRFAWEMCHEMKKTENLAGFLCFQQLPIPALSGLWRKALARYAKNDEPYSDAPWIDLLTQQFGDSQAAKYLLDAFNGSAMIIPKFYQLVFWSNDQHPRELQAPYIYMTRLYSAAAWATERALRGDPLVPIWFYAEKVAENPTLYQNNNGSDPTLNGGGQCQIWSVEEGYDIIPPMHMQQIRGLADQALQSAQQALPLVKTNVDEATRIRDFMQAYQYMSIYYQAKVNAAVAAIIYSITHKPADKTTALDLAQTALTSWQTAYHFLKTNLAGPMTTVYGRQFAHRAGAGETLDQLATHEQNDYDNIGTIFGWP